MSETEPTPADQTAPVTRRSIVNPVTVVILVVAIILASAGTALAFRSDSPDSGSVETGFLRDMVTHHNQAVEMALIVYRRTADPDLVTLSYDLATAQQAQVGMMMATLDLWDLSQTGTEPAMSWMGHPTTGPMPGMATGEQIGQLQTLPPAQADVLFLQLMIVHHRAGLDMSNGLLDRSGNDETRRFAETFSRTQGVEIDNMNAMLVARGQAPVDGSTVPGMSGMDMTTDATPTHPDHGG